MKKEKCWWCLGKEAYEKYHDEEWGVPKFDDTRIFEALTLESFQSGLSWWTILQKRENFRKAFDYFNLQKVASYNSVKVEELLQDKGIVRHKGKIEACINNAKKIVEMQQSGDSISDFLWKYVKHKPLQPNFTTQEEVPSQTELSQQITRDLKKEGFKFIGATGVYSLMQAIGMTNDHLVDCFRHQQLL